MIATKIKDHLENFKGHAALYQLNPPIRKTIFCDDAVAEYEHVVVSAVCVLGTPETYIFASNNEGEIVDWCELNGSYRGGLDHDEALANAGYEIKG